MINSVREITIANGNSSSDAIDLNQNILVTLHIPASFAGGNLEFDVAATETGDYNPLKDTTGAAIRYVAAASTVISVARADFSGVQFLKLRSVDASGNNVAQVADVVIGLVAADL